MLRRVTPFRRGFIEVPEDNTIRRFDLMSWGNSDLLDGEAAYRKRIFRKVYSIQMTAELPASDYYALKQVTSVVGTITNADNENPTVFHYPIFGGLLMPTYKNPGVYVSESPLVSNSQRYNLSTATAVFFENRTSGAT